MEDDGKTFDLLSIVLRSFDDALIESPDFLSNSDEFIATHSLITFIELDFTTSRS